MLSQTGQQPTNFDAAILPLGVLSRYSNAMSQVIRSRRDARNCERELWHQLCLCILSTVTRAESVAACVQNLDKIGILDRLARSPAQVSVRGLHHELAEHNSACRFPRQKAERLKGAALFFYGGGEALTVLGFLRRFPASIDARRALVEHVPGLGMKEASHFLRNIGHGADLAVIDVHVRRFLAEAGAVDRAITLSSSSGSYCVMEEVLLTIAFRTGLELGALDLAIWSFMREK
ncbi:MAG: hypothetical protein L3K14_04875 [Thermoplasmata archaeon]|nr:hypothetical protein [Thermoplasmata archaeon]